MTPAIDARFLKLGRKTVTEHLAETSDLFSRILVAVDLTDITKPLLHWAFGLAQRFKSEVYVAHIIPSYGDSGSGNQAEQRLRQLLDSINEAANRHSILIAQEPLSNAIERFVLEHQIDLVIAATHGATSKPSAPLGSGAEQIFRSATCPVLLIGPQVLQSAAWLMSVENILLATDYHSTSAACSYAISLAQQFAAQLIVLHVVEDPGATLREPLDHIRDIHMQRMRHAFHAIGPEIKINFSVKFGQAAGEILIAAKDNHANLLVMGAKPTTHWAQGVPLSTAYRVLAEASCPVLSVRADVS